MKKKLLVICLVIMFVLPVTVFAGSFLGLKVGAAAILNFPIDLETGEPFDPMTGDPISFDELGIDNVSFGADVRVNVSVVELAALLQGQVFPDGAFLYGHVGLGLSLELLGLVDFGVTAGPFLAAIVEPEGVTPLFDPENFKSFPLHVRVTADANLGGISVGGFLLVDPKVSIGQLMDPLFDPSSIDVPTTATAGLSVMIALL